MIHMYTTSTCGDCARAKSFLNQHNIEYKEINIEDNPEAIDQVLKINKGNRSVPTLLFDDGETLTEPTNQELAKKMGIKQ